MLVILHITSNANINEGEVEIEYISQGIPQIFVVNLRSKERVGKPTKE